MKRFILKISTKKILNILFNFKILNRNLEDQFFLQDLSRHPDGIDKNEQTSRYVSFFLPYILDFVFFCMAYY